MELLYSFDPERFRLSRLCIHGHRWPGTNQSLRDIRFYGCAGCCGAKQRDWLISFIDYEASGFEPGRKLGKLCPKGHRWEGIEVSLRSASGKCVECERLRSASRDPEKRRKYDAAYLARLGPEGVKRRNALRWQNITDEDRQRRNDHKRNVREGLRELGLTTKGTVPRNYTGAVSKAVTLELIARREKTRTIEKKLNALDREIRRDMGAEGRREYSRQRHRYRYQHDEAYRIYHREKSKRRKAELKNRISVKVKPKQILFRFSTFGGCCAYCGTKAEMEIEHFNPVAHGGTHVLSNILPACKPCNSSKTDHDPEAWYKRQPFFSKARWRRIRRVIGAQKGAVQQLALI